MSWKYLGEIFDIHGGGIDLVFPHHENEIAQIALRLPHAGDGELLDAQRLPAGRRGENGEVGGEFRHDIRPFAHQILWRTIVGGEVIRFAMLQTPYREPLDWTSRNLEQANSRLKGWKDFAADRTRSRKSRIFFDDVLGRKHAPADRWTVRDRGSRTATARRFRRAAARLACGGRKRRLEPLRGIALRGDAARRPRRRARPLCCGAGSRQRPAKGGWC